MTCENTTAKTAQRAMLPETVKIAPFMKFTPFENQLSLNLADHIRSMEVLWHKINRLSIIMKNILTITHLIY